MKIASAFIDEIKRHLVKLEVLVHSDMEGPIGMYEVFVDGIATNTPQAAKSTCTMCGPEEIAHWIAKSYKHVAFYEHTSHQVVDAILNKNFSYNNIRFAGWN